MKYILAVTLWLMLTGCCAGLFFIGGWRGSIAGGLIAFGALVALVVLMGRPPKD